MTDQHTRQPFPLVPPVLTTRHLILRPYDPEADTDELFALFHASPEAEKVFTYLPLGPYKDAKELRESYLNTTIHGDVRAYVVVVKETERLAGRVNFMSVSNEHRRVEIGHVAYGPEYQRTYVNSETNMALLEFAFEQWGARRVEWKCNNLNEKSKAAALRLGFTYEGLFRQHMMVKGQNRDSAWFSIIDSEWPQVKAALQTKLDKYE